MNRAYPPAMKKEEIKYESYLLAKDFVLSPFSFGENDVHGHQGTATS